MKRLYTLVTLLLFGMCAPSAHGQEAMDVLDFRLSKVRALSISLQYFSEETGRYTRAWGNRTQNSQNHVLVDYQPNDTMGLEDVVYEAAHQLLIDMALTHDIDVFEKELRASVQLLFVDRSMSTAFAGVTPRALPVLWSKSHAFEGSTREVTTREELLGRDLFERIVLDDAGLTFSFYAPLLESCIMHRSFEGSEVPESDVVPIRSQKYGFVSVSSSDLEEINARIPDDATLVASEYELVFSDGAQKRVPATKQGRDMLLLQWVPQPHLDGVFDENGYSVVLRNGVPNADYTFLWTRGVGDGWRVFKGVQADIHGDAWAHDVPHDVWISVGNLLSLQALQLPAFDSVLAGTQGEVADYRFALLDLVSRINAVPLASDERHVHVFYNQSMRDALCVLAERGLDVFAFTHGELAGILEAFRRTDLSYQCWRTLEANALHEEMLLALDEPFPPLIEILSITNGFSLATRRQAILDAVAHGPEGLDADQKRSIRRLLAGEGGKTYAFTSDEVALILNAVNN